MSRIFPGKEICILSEAPVVKQTVNKCDDEYTQSLLSIGRSKAFSDGAFIKERFLDSVALMG